MTDTKPFSALMAELRKESRARIDAAVDDPTAAEKRIALQLRSALIERKAERDAKRDEAVRRQAAARVATDVLHAHLDAELFSLLDEQLRDEGL